MGRYKWHIDSFEGGLADVPYSKQGDIATVLRRLDAIGGRFSCFEASANNRIASTMSKIEARGLVERTKDEGYPWVNVVLTDKGRALLGKALADAS